MIQILAQVDIEELPRFVGVFGTQGARMRRKHGSRCARVLRVTGQDSRVVVLFDWESRAGFEDFLSDPAVRETMACSGTIGRPEFTFLEELAEFPG